MQPVGKPLVIFNHENWLWDEECIVKTGEESIDFKEYNLKAFIYGHRHQQFMAQYKNGIKIYCTSTLDKGGRYNCLSAYREFTFDIGDKNDIRAETRFSNLKNQRKAEMKENPKVNTTAIEKWEGKAKFLWEDRDEEDLSVIDQEGARNPRTGRPDWSWRMSRASATASANRPGCIS